MANVDPNRRKSEQLGMPFGTACNRLRKAVLFSLLVRLKENVCFKCGKVIESADELSIEHKKVWLDVSADLFWDLSNIAFSHCACNLVERPSGARTRVVVPDGHSQCSRCRAVKPVGDFRARTDRWNGVSHECRACHP